MSRPRFSFIGLVTLFGAFLALMLAAFLPAHASAQAVAPPINEGWTRGGREVSLATVAGAHPSGRGPRRHIRDSAGPVRALSLVESSKLIRYV
jgi:hypothetical protein